MKSSLRVYRCDNCGFIWDDNSFIQVYAYVGEDKKISCCRKCKEELEQKIKEL